MYAILHIRITKVIVVQISFWSNIFSINILYSKKEIHNSSSSTKLFRYYLLTLLKSMYIYATKKQFLNHHNKKHNIYAISHILLNTIFVFIMWLKMNNHLFVEMTYCYSFYIYEFESTLADAKSLRILLFR